MPDTTMDAPQSEMASDAYLRQLTQDDEITLIFTINGIYLPDGIAIQSRRCLCLLLRLTTVVLGVGLQAWVASAEASWTVCVVRSVCWVQSDPNLSYAPCFNTSCASFRIH